MRYYASIFLFLRGMVFEWGTGVAGFHAGNEALVSSCDVTWEDTPALNTSCSVDVAEEFTRNYRAEHGGYNLFSNNCHHFANRLLELVSSSDCDGEHEQAGWESFMYWLAQRAAESLPESWKLKINPRDYHLKGRTEDEDESLPLIDK